MKVAPQIVTFLVLLIIGWVAYEKHDAFRALVNDVAQESKLFDGSNITRVEEMPADIDPDEYKSVPVFTMPVQQPGIKTEVPPVNNAATEKAQSEVTEQHVDQPAMADDASRQTNIVSSVPAISAQDAIFTDVPSKTDNEVADMARQEPIAPPEKELQLPDISEQSTIRPVPVSKSAEASKQTEMDIQADTPASSQKSVEQPVAVVQKIDGVKPQDNVQTVTPQSKTELVRQALTDARIAWNSGEQTRAIELYQGFMKQYPGHPDFAGELGNIYFSRGETKSAVNAYSEAFYRLNRKGERKRAAAVISLLYNIDQGQATLLEGYFSR